MSSAGESVSNAHSVGMSSIEWTRGDSVAVNCWDHLGDNDLGGKSALQSEPLLCVWVISLTLLVCFRRCYERMSFEDCNILLGIPRPC